MAWTQTDVENMPSEQYKELFNSNPDFRAAVDALDSQPVARRAIPTGTSTARDRAQLAQRAAEDPSFGKSFDPSFDEPIAPVGDLPPIASVVEEPAIEPIIPVAVPIELPELIHEYQPMDEAGKPVGGKQVFKYRTKEELIEKLTKAHSCATVMGRGARAKALVSAPEPLSEEGTPFPQYEEFPVMSAEEQEAAQRDLLDPEKAHQARMQLQESAHNAVANRQQESLMEVQIKLAFSEFRAENPDYFRCNENAQAIIGYLNAKNWSPTDKNNIQRAYEILRDNGALFGRPVVNQPVPPVLAETVPTVREEKTVPKTQALAEANARISAEVPPQAKRPVTPLPTGLSNADATSDQEPSDVSIESQLTFKRILKDGTGKPTGVIETLTGIAALDAMPSDQMKKLLEQDRRQERQTGKGTGFAKTVEQIEELREKRQREQRRRR